MTSRVTKPIVSLASLGALILATCLAATASTRLAILPTTAEFAAAADLLTASFTALNSVTLLEREEINRIWREQELSAAQAADFVKLGRVLDADGLLLLERRIDGTNDLLSVRLIAVKPGVVIAERRFALPLADPAEWGNSFAAQLERLLPKLALKADEAVPMSLLNLRSSLATSDARALEEELTALLHFCLAREPAIFVLERQRMEDLRAEKELLGTETEPFWNGAYVLDGTINRDQVSGQRISLHIRMAPPRGPPFNFEVVGRRDNAGDVIDELTRKILAALRKTPVAKAWQSDAEAQRFFQEAAWASRWHLWRQAGEAADASWALGQHTSPVAAHRVIARAWLAISMRGPLPYHGTGPYGFRPPPSAEGLSVLAQALEIYRHSFYEVTSITNDPAAWVGIGMDVLLATAGFLERYRQQPEFQVGYENDLGRLRELARDVNALLMTNQDRGPREWKSRDISGLPTVHGVTKRGRPEFLAQVWLEAGGVWHEKPHDALRLYQHFFAPSVYDTVRNRLLDVWGIGMPLTGWSFHDRQQLLPLWTGFLRQMAASTNTQMRLDGLRLLLHYGDKPDELARVAKDFADEAWKARKQLFLGQVEAPVIQVFSNLILRVNTWGQPPLAPLRALQSDWSRQWAEAGPDFSYEVWKESLSKLTNAITLNSGIAEPPIPPRPEQARALIASFESKEHEGNNRLRFFLNRLKASVGFTNDSSDTMAAKFAGEGRKATVTISRQWTLDQVQPVQGKAFGWWRPSVRNMVWDKDRLWLETAMYRRADRTPPIPTLLGIEPETMRTELIEAPFEEFADPRAPRRSLIVDDHVFLCASDALWERNASGQWRRLSVPLVGLAMPYLWRKQIVLSDDSSILQFDPKSSEVRILASARRNPPVSALDRVAGFAKAPLAVWPKDKLCALVSGQVWTYDETRNDWEILVTANKTNERLELQPAGVFYRQSGLFALPITGGWRPGSSELEFYTWSKTGTGIGPEPTPSYTPPLWIHPESFYPQDSKLAFDGANIWIFPALTGPNPSSPPSPRSLLVLNRKYERALEVKLEFAAAASEAEKAFDDARKNAFSYLEFLLSPAGLAILISERATLLWIPRTDLESALTDAARLDPQSERREFGALRRFDRDETGWLDDTERRAMRRDSEWQKEQRAILDAATDTNIAQWRAEWASLFIRGDRNNDGKLSVPELSDVAANHAQIFAPRLRGLNGPVSQVMRPYDLNSDFLFERPEFFAFLAEPRLLAVVNRSVEWVTKFGLKPAQCDTNDDGILDSGERSQVRELIRKRFDGQPARKD